MVRCNNGNLTGLTYSWAYKREKKSLNHLFLIYFSWLFRFVDYIIWSAMFHKLHVVEG